MIEFVEEFIVNRDPVMIRLANNQTTLVRIESVDELGIVCDEVRWGTSFAVPWTALVGVLSLLPDQKRQVQECIRTNNWDGLV